MGQSVHITMVKKRLASGEPCRKCIQTEEMLRQRGLWDRIDEVVWAVEDDPGSAGMQLGQRFGIDTAPFFLVADDSGQVSAIRSALQLIRDHLQPSRTAGGGNGHIDVAAAAQLCVKRFEHTARLLASLRTSPEGQEGLSAFLERRKASWIKD